MTDELDRKLSSPEGHAQFRQRLTTLIRAEAFTEADAFLNDQVRGLQSDIGDICRNLSVDSVEILGWDKLWAKIDRYSGKDAITAIGVDLSSHVENPKSSQGWAEPGLEINYFSDKYYPFSTASRLDILGKSESGGAPWQGNFVDIDNALEVRGLARLYTAIQSRGISPMMPMVKVAAGFADVLIGTGYLLLRFHQSVARDGQKNGLPRPMPILAGEHDFNALYIASVYMVDRITDHITSTDTAHLAENRDNFQKVWEKEFAQRREIHRMLGYFPFYRASGRAELAGVWEDGLKMACDITGVDPGRRITWGMKAGELTQILRHIAEAKGVPDVEGALDPTHTDRLHENWLSTAKAADFKLETKALSLFQIQLATALRKGGPWVIDRWERAKPYQAE
jgi:hypothetical protein